MTKEQIKGSLMAGFINGDGEEQERACLLAIQRIAENENKLGMHSCFMINLRDFLLEYNR